MAQALSDAALTQIENDLFAGKKILAIKFYREATGARLTEAKEAVEAIERLLRSTSPEKFTAPASKGGCAALIALMLLPAGLLALLG